MMTAEEEIQWRLHQILTGVKYEGEVIEDTVEWLEGNPHPEDLDLLFVRAAPVFAAYYEDPIWREDHDDWHYYTPQIIAGAFPQERIPEGAVRNLAADLYYGECEYIYRKIKSRERADAERLFYRHLFETLRGSCSFEIHGVEFGSGAIIPSFSFHPACGVAHRWRIHCLRLFEYRLEGKARWRFNYLSIDPLDYYDLGLKSTSAERPNTFLNFAPGFIVAHEYRFEFIGTEQHGEQPPFDF